MLLCCYVGGVVFFSYAPLSRLPEGVWHTTTYCVAAPACCAVYVVFAISCVVCCVVMFCCVFELCSSLSCQRVCGTLLLWRLLHPAACSDKRSQKLPITTRGAAPAVQLPINPSSHHSLAQMGYLLLSPAQKSN